MKGTRTSVRGNSSKSTPNLPTGATWLDKLHYLFKEWPFLSNTVAAVSMDASGDILCQKLQQFIRGSRKVEEAGEEQSPSTQPDLDFGRVLRFVVFGVLGVPIDVAWYRLLDSPKMVSLIKSSFGSNALRVALGKTLIDSGTFGPVMLLVFSMAMYTMKTIEYESLDSVNIRSGFEYAKEQFLTLWASECVFWFVFWHHINHHMCMCAYVYPPIALPLVFDF